MSTATKTRRRKGEGSISRHHNHPTCPPVVEGKRPEHKCKGLWRARATVTVQGRKVTKVVYGKTEAEVVAAKKALVINESQGRVAANGRKMTLGEWAEVWFTDAKQDLKPGTWQNYRCRLDAWIIPAFGDVRIDRVTDRHIEDLFRAMRRLGRKEGTCQQVYAVVRLVLAAARKERLIPFNPCDDVKAPSQTEQEERRPLTVDEALRVLAAAGDDPRPAMALMTGLRQGEVLALRWSDLYLDGTKEWPMPHLVVRRSRSKVNGQAGYVYGTPKTKRSKDRVVPLVLNLPDLLRKKKAAMMQAGTLVADGPIFMSRLGNPLNRSSDLEHWYKWLDKAGVERTPLHAARNTVAGLLESAEVGDRVVMQILGHTNVKMTHHYQAGNRAAVIAGMEQLDTFMKRQADTRSDAA